MTRQQHVFVTIVAICIMYGAAITAVGLSTKPIASDIAVVLGNEVLADGTPSKALQSRLDAALSVYNAHMVKIIVVSGGKGKSGYEEAVVMDNYLHQHGVPQDKIIQDMHGINTRATAENTAKLMKQYHWKSVIIVSQFYHLARCIFAFHEAGIANLSATYPSYFPKDIPALLREEVALIAYFLGAK